MTSLDWSSHMPSCPAMSGARQPARPQKVSTQRVFDGQVSAPQSNSPTGSRTTRCLRGNWGRMGTALRTGHHAQRLGAEDSPERSPLCPNRSRCPRVRGQWEGAVDTHPPSREPCLPLPAPTDQCYQRGPCLSRVPRGLAAPAPPTLRQRCLWSLTRRVQNPAAPQLF